MAPRNSSKSAASTGSNPQNTTGCAGFEARQRLGALLLLVGDRVADAGVGHLLDLRGDEADLAGAELLDILHLRAEDADPVDLVMGVGTSSAQPGPSSSRRR
ncbi:MAG: hypothetical protein U1E19_13005 [Rhodoblastus sp.]